MEGFVLDQNVERELAVGLHEAGYDVERVVSVPELGEGTDDTAILSYARQNGLFVVTYDSDFVALQPTGDVTVLFVPDSRLPPHRIVSVVEAIFTSYESPDSMESVVYVTEDWL